MWPKLKHFLETMNLGVSIVGGIASALIAWFAYQIDQTVQERALQETRVNRSVALMQSLAADAAITRLKIIGNRIEQQVGRSFEVSLAGVGKGEDPTSAGKPPPDFKGMMVEAVVKEVNADAGVRSDLTILLQHVSRAARCADFVDHGRPAENAAVEQRELLCDPNTFLVLSGELLFDLYMVWRPAISCDGFFSGDELDEYYGLVRAHVELAENGAWQVFTTAAEADEAAANGNFIVVAFGPPDHCEHYRELVVDAAAVPPLSRA